MIQNDLLYFSQKSFLDKNVKELRMQPEIIMQITHHKLNFTRSWLYMHFLAAECVCCCDG